MSNFSKAIAEIDAANAADPTIVATTEGLAPAELLYGRRMSEELARLYPEASEALRLAARAQHIERWTIPRADYPMDRAGYHRWRNALKDRHAELAGKILLRCGYGPEMTARVGQLIRKESLKTDAEAQALEDVACLVFLRHYAGPFAAKHEDAKLKTILARTWAKMSDHGRAAALQLTLPPRLQGLLKEVLLG